MSVSRILRISALSHEFCSWISFFELDVILSLMSSYNFLWFYVPKSQNLNISLLCEIKLPGFVTVPLMPFPGRPVLYFIYKVVQGETHLITSP